MSARPRDPATTTTAFSPPYPWLRQPPGSTDRQRRGKKWPALHKRENTGATFSPLSPPSPSCPRCGSLRLRLMGERCSRARGRLGSAIFGRSIARLNGGWVSAMRFICRILRRAGTRWVSEGVFCCWRRCGRLVSMALMHCSVLMTFLPASFASISFEGRRVSNIR